MKLSDLVVTGFRSVKQKENLIVDEKVTILIGANDHGKTNLLEAIACLNDDRVIKEDERNWDLKPEEVVEIEWHFACDSATSTKLKEWALPPVIAIKETPVTVAAGAAAETAPAAASPTATSPVPAEERPQTFPVNKGNKVVYIVPGLQ